MPELPEVETVRRGLEQQTSQFKVAKVVVHRSRAIASPPDPEGFCQALTGCRLGTWSRRGKYLYAELQREGDAAGHWGVHLRMTGQFLWIETDPANPSPPPCSHTRVQFE
jgi:formamidopyrimidine-DNA glycosylase